LTKNFGLTIPVKRTERKINGTYDIGIRAPIPFLKNKKMLPKKMKLSKRAKVSFFIVKNWI